MRFSKLASALFAAVLMVGCADPVVFSEVFQQTKEQKIYTKYNLWYTDPLQMDVRNIQQGSFIPVGTEPVALLYIQRSVPITEKSSVSVTYRHAEPQIDLTAAFVSFAAMYRCV